MNTQATDGPPIMETNSISPHKTTDTYMALSFVSFSLTNHTHHKHENATNYSSNFCVIADHVRRTTTIYNSFVQSFFGFALLLRWCKSISIPARSVTCGSRSCCQKERLPRTAPVSAIAQGLHFSVAKFLVCTIFQQIHL